MAASSPSEASADGVPDTKAELSRTSSGMKMKQAILKTKLSGSLKLARSFRTLRDMRSDDVALIKDSDLKVVRELGAGAFGTVDLCEYTAGGKTIQVAVKRLNPGLVVNKFDFESFISECKLLRKMRHRCDFWTFQA